MNCIRAAVLSSSARGIRVFPARLPRAAATHAARSVAKYSADRLRQASA